MRASLLKSGGIHCIIVFDTIIYYYSVMIHYWSSLYTACNYYSKLLIRLEVSEIGDILFWYCHYSLFYSHYISLTTLQVNDHSSIHWCIWLMFFYHWWYIQKYSWYYYFYPFWWKIHSVRWLWWWSRLQWWAVMEGCYISCHPFMY